MNTAPLWRKQALLSALNLSADTVDFKHISGVSIDTRTIEKGDLYVALKGETHNGHDYVEMALEKGAHAALISETPKGFTSHTDAPLIKVNDTLNALEMLGKAARNRSNATRIGITGSVGKTTTRAITEQVLRTFGSTHASVKSFNNHIGVPLTLTRMPQQTDFGIFEMGMNHAGELTALSHQVSPHIALITEIAPAHIEHLGTLENIAKAKAEIFAAMEEGGTAILNINTPYVELLSDAAEAKGLNIWRYGSETLERYTDAPADLSFSAPIQTRNGLTFTIRTNASEPLDITTPLIGTHMAKNIAAVLSIAAVQKLDLTKAAQALTSLSLPDGRGVIKTLVVPHADAGETFTLIDESYNANPASMRAALAVLSDFEALTGGRKWALLADMFELGAHSAAEHLSLKQVIETAEIDGVFLVGPEMKRLYDALKPSLRLGYAADAREAESIVLSALEKDDIVMVKGSNGMKLAHIIDALSALQPNP